MVAVASMAIWHVARQAFFAAEQPAPFRDCAEGLQALSEAVDRGRRAARFADGDAEGSHDDEAALLRYREAVQPIWRHRDAVARLCREVPELRGALDSIERLRYAEEHNVRSQAAELAPLRRRVRTIVKERLTAGTPPGPARSP